MKHQIIFTVLLLIVQIFNTLPSYSQEENLGQIKGQILDQSTLLPIEFCNVNIIDINLGTSTDSQGEFTLSNVPEGKFNLTISFMGYQEKVVTEIRVIRRKTAYIEEQLTPNEFKLNEVTVQVFKYEEIATMPTGTYSLSKEEIFRSPASNGNIFKAISVIPGVQSGGGSFSALAVRGQGSEENATFVDGFPVFELSHLAGGAGNGISGGFDDPNGGRFSIFGPRVIDGLVIQTGGFSSLYGRKSSSYLGLDVKEGNPETKEFDIMGSLTGLSANYSGPSFGKKSTLFAAWRYQNFVPALNLTGQGELGNPSFSDFTIKHVTKLNKKNKLTVLALFNPEWFTRTTDHIDKDDKKQNSLLADANNQKGLLGIKLTSLSSDKNYWNNFVYYRMKRTELGFGKAYPIFLADGIPATQAKMAINNHKGGLDNTEEEIGTRSIYTMNMKKNIQLKSGIDMAIVSVNHSRTISENDTVYSFYRKDMPADQRDQNYMIITPEKFNATFKEKSANFSAYSTLHFSPIKNFVLNTGLRYDYTGFSEKGKISPRLSLSYKLNEKTSFNASTGIFYQDPLFIHVADNDDIKLDPEQAIHFIGGFKHHFSSDLKFTVEGYYKSFDDMIVKSNGDGNQVENKGDGYAYGVDISLVKRLSKNYNAQVNYSYSQSKRDNKDGIGLYDYLYSQPHIFNFLVSYQTNSNWIFSGKFRYSTGQPTNSSLIFSNVFNSDEFLRYGQELTGRNDIRNEDFVGVDIRVDRRIQMEKFSLNIFWDIQNVLNRTNASTRNFFETTGHYEPQALGILPTVGFRIEF